MGKSSGYCFKIIACGSSESIDKDDPDSSCQNKGSDKRGWSFRKRAAGHRVLSNTVISETLSSENKNSEPVVINSEQHFTSSIHEKSSANQFTQELPQVSTSTTKGSTVSSLVTEAADENDIKFDSISDESAVVVIQAAVRKFLAQREVTRHKKVVKLQAVVRGHLVRCRAAGTLRCIQAIYKMQVLVRVRHASLSLKRPSIGNKGIKDSSKPHPTYISIAKLLSNRFAIQLLESSPRTKQINIKCDPSNNDLAWKWLERWTYASSPEVMQPYAMKHEQEKVNDTKNQIGNDNFEQKSDFFSAENTCLNTGAEIGPVLFPEKPIVETELPKRSAERVATDQADSEGRKSLFGSRKLSNPTFIAAHSRFEELTSKNSSLTSVSSSSRDHAVGDTSLYVEPVNSSGYESLRVGQSQTGGSECGTELSITSMLDSPDPSEVGNIEYNKESKVLDNEEHALLGTELTHSIFVLSEKYDDMSQVKQTAHEENASNTADIELESETGRQVYKSPEASPRSHVTTQGTPSSVISNNKTKSNKKLSTQKPKSWSYSKKSPVSSNRGSSLRNSLDNLPRETKTANRRNSFGSQSSEPIIDQEPRDSSSSNCIPSYMQVTESARAKSLANNNSPRSSPDVQGKEAAAYIKKRHSLPGSVNGRHGSPRVKRSSPQAQQTTKGKDNPERKWQN